MKRKNKILVTMKALTLAAAMAVIAVFSSCRKEPVVGESASGTTDGVRVISVQFDNSTKAALSGVTPTFTNNDKIRVSNSEKSEECTVTVSGPSATFTTTLSGELTAIYPAAAADYTGSGPISSQAFKVPANQTGKVEDAIIAKATIASNSATFTGVTALFEITPPSTAKIITVTSLKKVESGSRTGAAADINTENTGKTVITVGDGSADLPGTIYVAFVPGVNLTDLSFDAGEDIGLKGIPTSKLGTGPDETAANAKYTIDGTNWHPYVTIGGKKWATINIGATLSTDAGKFFAWGDVEGQTLSGSTFSTSFDWAHAPFNDGQSDYDASYFASVKDTECPGGILALKNDAANVNWGGSWRMPNEAEFDVLASETKVWDSTNKGYTFGTSPNTIFLFAAGYSVGADRFNLGSLGCYWSSSLNTGGPDNAFRFNFNSAVANMTTDLRCGGRLVRALSE